MARSTRAGPSLALLLAVSYALLGTAWVLGNPAGAAPDETAHYLKALAVADGQPAGQPADLAPSPGDGERERWMKRTTRALDVPPGLSPEGLQCNVLRPAESARCQERARPPQGPSKGRTYMGTHQPFLYVVPGVLARTADDPVSAIRWARVGGAVTALALVVAAVALLWEGGAGTVSVVGLVVAVTPMVVFLASSVTTSGPEIAGAVCFLSALIRLTRSSRAHTWAWTALGASGMVLAGSRSLGPLWVVLLLVVVGAAHGFRRVLAVVAGDRRAVWALSAVGTAVVASVAWEVTVQPHGRTTFAEVWRLVVPALRELPELLRQQIGVFGSLDTALPPVLYWAWSAMVLLVLLLAVAVGSVRERVVLVALPPAIVVVTVAVSVLNRTQTGFGMQGRYVLPLVVAVPVLAGATLFRHRRGVGSPLERLHWLLVGAAGVHALSWYVNARRSAVGVGTPWLFIPRSEWTPALGWYPLLALVIVAAGLMALYPVLARQRRLARLSPSPQLPSAATRSTPG